MAEVCRVYRELFLQVVTDAMSIIITRLISYMKPFVFFTFLVFVITEIMNVVPCTHSLVDWEWAGDRPDCTPSPQFLYGNSLMIGIWSVDPTYETNLPFIQLQITLSCSIRPDQSGQLHLAVWLLCIDCRDAYWAVGCCAMLLLHSNLDQGLWEFRVDLEFHLRVGRVADAFEHLRDNRHDQITEKW